jgi:Domain of unknown function (DUF4189)
VLKYLPTISFLLPNYHGRPERVHIKGLLPDDQLRAISYDAVDVSSESQKFVGCLQTGTSQRGAASLCFSARKMRVASRLSPASLDGFDMEGMAVKLQLLLGPMLGLLMLMTGRAQAQTHVCGAGPGPGEVLVGEMPGGNGVAADPLCDWVQGSGQASQAPHIPIAPPPPQILFYGAFAIDQKMRVSASWNHPSVDGAMKSAYDACLRGNGGGCRVISKKAFQNCGAVSADGAGLVYMVTDPVCLGSPRRRWIGANPNPRSANVTC